MPAPILLFDMDGTLLDEQGLIHPADCDLLRAPPRRAGLPPLLIPTTGRPLSSQRTAFTRSGLFRRSPIPFPMNLENGGALFLPHEQPLAVRRFTPAQQAHLLAEIAAHPEFSYALNATAGVQVLGAGPLAQRLFRRFDFEFLPFRPDPACPYSKITVVSEAAALLAAFAARAAAAGLSITSSQPEVIEICPPDLSKGRGARQLFAALGYPDAPFFVVGDGENDLPVFALAAATPGSLSFAPSSAPAAIRAAADCVIERHPDGLLGPMLARWQQRFPTPA